MGTSGKTFDMFSVEVLGSYRSMRERIYDHPMMTAWFILFLIAGFSTTLLVAEYVKTLDIPILLLTRGDILFVIFFFFMGKSSSETMDLGLKNNRLKHLFTAPVRINEIRNTVFMKIFWNNLLLLAISVSLATSLRWLLRIELYADRFFFLHMYLLVIAAVLIGYNLSILSRISNRLLKYVSLAIYGQNITFTWFILRGTYSSQTVSLALGGIIASSLIVYHITTDLFLDSWILESSRSVSSVTHLRGENWLLKRCTSKTICSITEKEILDRWRRRETAGTLGIVAVIGFGLVVLYHQLGPNPDLGFGLEEVFYPIFIGMSVFLAVILQLVIPSLTLFSREGRRMWAIKVLPIIPEDVIYGKLLSMLIFSPTIIVLIAIPLPILLGYPLSRIFFMIISSITLILISSGIGIWASARFPNFDESVNGSPDVMTMYIVMMSCLIIGALFIVPPLLILRSDAVLGLLMMILSADIALLFTSILSQLAASIFNAMQLDM